VGVGIIVDAVINHMTNYPSPGVGSNGTNYSKYEYPGLYTAADFIRRASSTTTKARPTCRTASAVAARPEHGARVRAPEIADYLLTLARLGVAGFRIDAAKHIQQVSSTIFSAA